MTKLSNAARTNGLEIMRLIDSDYRKISGLQHRKHYSIFYSFPRKANFLMLNANPGGTPDNYTYVNVEEQQHEYIEGVGSSKTTQNGARMLRAMVGSAAPDSIRHVQVSNIAFRRSRDRSQLGLPFAKAVREAAPALTKLIEFICPRTLLFAGDANVKVFANAHGATMQEFGDERIEGPNGSSAACYFSHYSMNLPCLGKIDAYSIYHPSKHNHIFDREVLPVLRRALGDHIQAIEQ